MGFHDSATRRAKERDHWICQWHLVVLEVTRPGSHGHHLFRPRSLYDDEKYIVTLCDECHAGERHTSGRLTDRMLVERVMIPYIWGGDDLTPPNAILKPTGRPRGRPRKIKDQT